VGKKPKIPKRSVDLQTAKNPRRDQDPGGIYSERFSFSLRVLDMQGPFGWSLLSQEHCLVVLERLKQLESLTWREILVDQARENHAVAVERLAGEAQTRLETIGQGDTAELVSLRVQKRFRIWGIRMGTTFLLLWYDPFHRVFPMNITDN